MRSGRRVPSRSKICSAPRAHEIHVASPRATATLPGTRAVSVVSPRRQVTSESAPRYSIAATSARAPLLERETDVFRPHAQREPCVIGRSDDGTLGSGDDGAVATGGERNEVHRRRADEPRDELVGGTLVELGRRRVLLHAAAIEQDDAIGHRHRFRLVVRDVHHRHSELLLQLADLGAHALAQLRIEVRQRLVHQAYRRLGDDRPAERDALLLAARELRRLARQKFGDAEKVGDAGEPLLHVRRDDVAHSQAEHDVLADRQMRKQRVRLEHHRDVALRGREMGDVASADQDAAVVSGFQSRDQPQRRRLAATRGAEQHVERARLEREREAVDRANLAVRRRPVLAHVLGGDGRHGCGPRQWMMIRIAAAMPRTHGAHGAPTGAWSRRQRMIAPQDCCVAQRGRPRRRAAPDVSRSDLPARHPGRGRASAPRRPGTRRLRARASPRRRRARGFRSR